MKKIMIISAAIVLLAGGGASAYYFTALGDDAVIGETLDSEAVAAETVAEERDALFHTLPPLVVSSHYNGSLRYLQVKLSILTRNEETLEKLRANTPLIQNALIMLLDTFKFSELDNAEGKEALRAQAEEEVRNLINDEEVESVLFTGFVIQ
ncbi:MAG: flagellar basal body-associated FliL family protein [Gammaproteobacteria bacterium]|nr:flagellar basal body-associated FliL family protein [Gammaproteobacteria bacterium]